MQEEGCKPMPLTADSPAIWMTLMSDTCSRCGQSSSAAWDCATFVAVVHARCATPSECSSLRGDSHTLCRKRHQARQDKDRGAVDRLIHTHRTRTCCGLRLGTPGM